MSTKYTKSTNKKQNRPLHSIEQSSIPFEQLSFFVTFVFFVDPIGFFK